ncbi:MAG: SIS domain-containing protein [Deltaproteobacteria bacterium]|jgi:D-sedoheptulose 7-phosphate isomerase|nr:MAG: SIS domain-containing protein [Deltaproteobacteria bacterium]
MDWISNVEELRATLHSLSARDRHGRETDTDSSFAQWKNRTLRVRSGRRTVFLIGNGASASMASHIAADLAKNAHIHTEVFSDLSLITAIANDLSYEEVFAEPLRRRMVTGDMLVAISSSGQSPNIIRAVQEATVSKGFIVTFSAMEPGNMLRLQGNLNYYVPAQTYGMAESCHAAILHYWVDIVAERTTGFLYSNQLNVVGIDG